MSTQPWFPTSGVNGLRSVANLGNNSERPARVAVFGSFVGGVRVINELVFGERSEDVHVVGVATDDPAQAHANAKVRLWKYPHSPEDEVMVPRLAQLLDLPVFTGRVKSPEFFELIIKDWKPDLCLMATFGQKIPRSIIDLPKLGFFNFHHSGPTWPSYPGPDPIAAMQRDGLSHLVLTMHRVSDVIDGGEFFARSHPVAIPPGIDAIEMHRITWPQMGPFIGRALDEILDAAVFCSSNSESLFLQEQPRPYRVQRPLQLAGFVQ
jgi:methionyl-tRNA formyltransferase